MQDRLAPEMPSAGLISCLPYISFLHYTISTGDVKIKNMPRTGRSPCVAFEEEKRMSTSYVHYDSCN